METKTNTIYYKAFEQKILKKANMYFNMVRVKSKSFPDTGLAAFHLWTKVAIPSILYGVDSTDVSKHTWNQLISIHHKIGKFILQVPYNTQNISGLVAYGLEPLYIIQMDRINSLHQRLIASTSPIIKECVTEMRRQQEKNLFQKQVQVLMQAQRDGEDYKDFRTRVLRAYLEEELERVEATTFYFMPRGSVTPRSFFRLDQDKQKQFNRFILMNSGLGNRAPSECGIRLKECLGCRIMSASYYEMNEMHLLLKCPRYSSTRRILGIDTLIQNLNESYRTPQEAYVKYFGKNAVVSKDELAWRVDCAVLLKEVYLKDVPVMKQHLRRYKLSSIIE